eukprot:15473581-Alexandrium_andersonii.AAC.1
MRTRHTGCNLGGPCPQPRCSRSVSRRNSQRPSGGTFRNQSATERRTPTCPNGRSWATSSQR